MGLINLPAFLMGFPLETLAGLLAFRGLWAVYIHSNVRLPIGPLRVLIGAPELHHWHHSKEREAGNYANISPLMDLIFGTYRCPDHEPEELGVAEPMPKSYLGQMIYPFRRKPAIQENRQRAGALQDAGATNSAPDERDRILECGSPLPHLERNH
jgi:sterol desaturase/sphingolipid hydroxylase (fatty acid hydroxylase superfamily)